MCVAELLRLPDDGLARGPVALRGRAPGHYPHPPIVGPSGPCVGLMLLLLSSPVGAPALYALLLLPASTSSGARALYGSSDIFGASRGACAVGWLRARRLHRHTGL